MQLSAGHFHGRDKQDELEYAISFHLTEVLNYSSCFKKSLWNFPITSDQNSVAIKMRNACATIMLLCVRILAPIFCPPLANYLFASPF
jgi:hypothetical protein